MEKIEAYRSRFLEVLAKARYTQKPVNLYEPIDYILNLGGKRIRPVLVYMGADCYSGAFEDCDNAALAIEVFHNFTLVHDDIMDEAPLRRGEPTVHKKYDTNTAILSGDVMLIKSYELLNTYRSSISGRLLTIFNKMATEVCEGQQMDMDFEKRQNVSIEEYLKMIEYKTSVLLAASLQMGAIIGGASVEAAHHLYNFGVNAGIAFQMQDDILDTFGSDKVGKQDGGDIIQNKKTYLYLKALELCDSDEKERLLHWYNKRPEDPSRKVEEVRSIFENTHVRLHAEEVKASYLSLAYAHLDDAAISDSDNEMIRAFAEYLSGRVS